MTVVTNNPLSAMSYTNKDFNSIFVELLDIVKELSSKWDPTISNESDPGVILLKADAIIADKNNYNIDKNILELYPETVTQEFNARNIYKQLAYRMPWYKSATTSITFKWVGEQSLVGATVSIPKYTMLTSSDGTVVYTLVEEVLIDADHQLATGDAIEGTFQTLTINGSQVIDIVHLDSNNRIYLPDATVAENGIFITNVSKHQLWKQVDNLQVIPKNTLAYEFGIDSRTSTCYIEFPDDIDKLIESGLNVQYIVSQGSEGNVSAQFIDRFYGDVTVSIGNDELLLNESTVQLYNPAASVNGRNPETIEEAYKSYKKVAGTFDTLVTLRDYANAIYNSELVSNAIVSDRVNDVQCSYTITTEDPVNPLVTQQTASSRMISYYKDTVPFDGDIGWYSYDSEKGMELVPAANVLKGQELYRLYADNSELNPFDLKLYLLHSPGVIASIDDYESTFNLEHPQSAVEQNVKGYLYEQQCIQHNFSDILANLPCLFKNSFPVSIKIVPQHKLTTLQMDQVKRNIITALWNVCNSRAVEFGAEPNYDLIYSTIQNADDRIKTVILDEFDYTTFATYWDANTGEFKDIPISNSTSSLVIEVKNKDECKNNYKKFATQLTKSGLQAAYFITKEPSGDVYRYNDRSNDFDLYSTQRPTIQKQVLAKSVLAGRTPLFNDASAFEYKVNHKFIEETTVNRVTTLSAIVPFKNTSDTITSEGNTQDITLEKETVNIDGVDVSIHIPKSDSTANTASYTLQENESIRFLAPAFKSDVNYSNYAKFQLILANKTGDTKVPEDYSASIDSNSATYQINAKDYNATIYDYIKDGLITVRRTSNDATALSNMAHGDKVHIYVSGGARTLQHEKVGTGYRLTTGSNTSHSANATWTLTKYTNEEDSASVSYCFSFGGDTIEQDVKKKEIISFDKEPEPGSVEFCADGGSTYTLLSEDTAETGERLGTYTAPSNGKVRYSESCYLYAKSVSTVTLKPSPTDDTYLTADPLISIDYSFVLESAEFESSITGESVVKSSDTVERIKVSKTFTATNVQLPLTLNTHSGIATTDNQYVLSSNVPRVTRLSNIETSLSDLSEAKFYNADDAILHSVEDGLITEPSQYDEDKHYKNAEGQEYPALWMLDTPLLRVYDDVEFTDLTKLQLQSKNSNSQYQRVTRSGTSFVIDTSAPQSDTILGMYQGDDAWVSYKHQSDRIREDGNNYSVNDAYVGVAPIIHKAWIKAQLKLYTNKELYRVEANSDYQLRTGDSIVFFWRNEDSDNDDAPYQYRKYTGTNSANATATEQSPIIRPSFRVEGMSLGNAIIDPSQLNDSGVLYPGDDLYHSVVTMYGENDLSGSKSIETRSLKQRVLDNNKDNYYFITNTTDAATHTRYEMTLECQSDITKIDKWYEGFKAVYRYTLQTDEYFVRTNKTYTAYEIFHPGTLVGLEITWTTSSINDYIRQKYPKIEDIKDYSLYMHLFKNHTLKVSHIPYDEIMVSGITAFSEYCATIPTAHKMFTREQQVYNIIEGNKLMIKKREITDVEPPVFKSWVDTAIKPEFEVSYTTDIGEAVTLPSVNIQSEDYSWTARACLNLNLSQDEPQQITLLSNTNQSVQCVAVPYTSNDGGKQTTTYRLFPEPLTKDAPTIAEVRDVQPVYVQSSVFVNRIGGTNIDVSYVDLLGDRHSVDLYMYALDNFDADALNSVFSVRSEDLNVVCNLSRITDKIGMLSLTLDIDSKYILSVDNLSDKTPVQILVGEKLLQPMNSNSTNVGRGTYYYRLKTDSQNLLQLKVQLPDDATDLTDIDLVVFGTLLRYTDNELFSNYGSSPDEILELIQDYDIKKIYKYNNRVTSKDECYIKDPLSSKSFFDVNHIMNPYTIAKAELRLSAATDSQIMIINNR